MPTNTNPNQHILIMGLGRFGGGLGVARYLAQTNPNTTILITDLAQQHELTEPIALLAGLSNIALRLGEHRIDDFTTASLVVANPAVPNPWLNPYLRAAADANVPITTEISILTTNLKTTEHTIAITGTAGKSTTSAMIHHALANLNQTPHLGGNIGGSLLTKLAIIKPTDPIVLELSSAQLHWLHNFRSAVAVVTNISNNHTDWHGDSEHYQTSKQRLLAHQQPTDAAILGPSVHHWNTNPGVHRTHITNHTDFPSQPTSPNPVIPGEHNRTNAAIATAAVHAYLNKHNIPADITAIEHAVASFPGLPHRLAFVAEVAGVRYYNDSKSTTPTSLELAVRSLAAEPNINNIHLIAGGYDKGNKPTEYKTAFAQCQSIHLIGATADALATAAQPPARAHIANTLDNATRAAIAAAQPGDAVLLSPGCASWDQFTNYEQRGDTFATIVLNHRNDSAKPASPADHITTRPTTPTPSAP